MKIPKQEDCAHLVDRWVVVTLVYGMWPWKIKYEGLYTEDAQWGFVLRCANGVNRLLHFSEVHTLVEVEMPSGDGRAADHDAYNN